MRSTWKPSPTTPPLEQKNRSLRSRSSHILPSDVGHKVAIHDGRRLSWIQIRNPMVGFKFGSFMLTKRLGGGIHLSPSKKKNKKR